jgi:SAM-dependent methyltransferase
VPDLNSSTGYRPGFKFHDENLRMLGWYAQRLVAAVRRAGARSLISLGIGHQVVSRTILERLGGALDEYTIVEGSAARIAEFRAQTPLPAFARLENAFFEQFEAARPVDAIEMGFVLEHVDDPRLVLSRFVSFLRPGGVLVIVVPNARSLHRLVGHRAGLLDDLYRLSPHDFELGHQRYFDLQSIRGLAREAGLTVRATEGVFLKCLTTEQLARLGLSDAVMEGFFRVAVELPEISNAIYLETTR